MDLKLDAAVRENLLSIKAQADLLQARLGYLLAWVELEQAVGRTPGF
jgi:outer membrane protein TolC